MEQGYLSVCPSVRPRMLQKKVCLLPFVDFYHYRIIIVFFDTLQSERTIHVFILIHTLSLTLILKNATTTPLGKSLQHWNGWSFDFTFSQVTSEWMTLICLVIPSVLVSYKSLGSSGRIWICLQFNYSFFVLVFIHFHCLVYLLWSDVTRSEVLFAHTQPLYNTLPFSLCNLLLYRTVGDNFTALRKSYLCVLNFKTIFFFHILHTNNYYLCSGIFQICNSEPWPS